MMAVSNLSISVDGDEYIAALNELSKALPDLEKTCPEFLLRLNGLLNLAALIARDGDCLPTSGTNPLIVHLKPSDGLLRLLSALRAGKRDAQSLNCCFDHDFSSVGCGPSNEEGPSGESQGSSDGYPCKSQDIAHESACPQADTTAVASSPNPSSVTAVTHSPREVSSAAAPGMAHPLDIPDFLKRRT